MEYSMKMEEYKEKTKVKKVKSCFDFTGRQYMVLQAVKIHNIIRDGISGLHKSKGE